MADARMPEEFYEMVRGMLPAEKEVGPQGGRPPTRHHTVLKVIWYVLVTGNRWKDVPKEMGCCGETARTRLQAWERAGIWSRLHQLLLTMLNHDKQLHLETAIIDTTQVRAFGGDAGFDSESTRCILRWLCIEPHIRRRGDEHGGHLGRVRWVVERTISWIKGLRRMRVRYDRSAMSINAWTSIAAAVVCLHILLDAVS